MKQVQYRRSAQSTGFRPAQVSDANISRMREESARVVQGMRDVRDAEIKERNRQLAQEKENQQLEARLRDRNRQVETANHQRELTGLQQEARAQQQQFNQTQAENAKILEGIAGISETAGKAYTKYVEAKEDETIAEEFANFVENPYYETEAQIRNELGLDTIDEFEQSKIDEYEANGGDPVAASKARNFSKRVQRELKKAKAAYFYQYKYPGLLQEAIEAENAKRDTPMSSAELAGFITDTGRIVSEKFRTEGGVNLKPGSMRTALEFREKHHMGVLTKARAAEVQNERQRSMDNATTILTQNPAEFSNNIIQGFRAVYRANGFDYKAAHDWYVGLATMRGPDGNYLFTAEQLASTVLMDGEKPYAQERPGRWASMLEARLKEDNSYRKLQIQAEDIAYKEAEQNALEQIAANPTKETVEALIGQFRDTYAKVPASLTKYEENYTVEARTKAKQIEQYLAIPDGFILKEQVDALTRLDATAGKELEERYALQERKYNSGTYKELSDAFKTTANGVTTYGNQKPNNAASLALQRGMRAEFRRRVDRRVAGGADFITSAELIAQQIEDEVKRDARSKDPDALFYRKLSGRPGGAAEFPNLYSKANLTAFEEARRNYLSIVQSVADNGLEKTLDTAESILTREEIASIVQGYGKPGFVIPTDVLAVSGMGNGLDPFTIINRQIAALGDPELLPLEPPAIIQSINSTMTDQQRQDLFNAVNGPRQRLRALQQTAGTVARPSNLRAGFAGNSLKRSFTDALTYEGNKGAYQQTGQALQQLGFQVAEHPDFGGVAPVHAGNSFHGYGEAFDITHQTGNREDSIEKTRQLKDLIRSMNLFKEVIGPGDGDPAHETHLHLGGLMRPLTAEDIEILNSFN